MSRPATKVLLVDDDEIVLDYLSLLLVSAGFKVAAVTNGEAALHSMRQDLAQIVVLDIGMPGMDGLALCRAIRRQTYSGYVYIMLHTAKDKDKDILDGMDAGADDYLCKGASRDQIISRLHVAQRTLSDERTLTTSIERRARIAMIDAPTATKN
jgi:phosphoserine phosphatase RsbU/P